MARKKARVRVRKKAKRKKAKGRASGRRGRGRPPVHEESWRKTTVVLFDRQIAELDELAGAMRAKHGSGPTRAEIIRGVVDGVLSSPLNLAKASAETEIRSLVTQRLKRSPAKRKARAEKPHAERAHPPEPTATEAAAREPAQAAPVSLGEEAARLRQRAAAIRQENPTPKLEEYRKRGRPMEYQSDKERWVDVMKIVDALEGAAYRLKQETN